MPDPAETLGELLTRELRARRLSQERWAREIGRDQGTVSKWCRDILFPGPEMIPVVARFLGLDEDTVLAFKYRLQPMSFAELERHVGELERQTEELRGEVSMLSRSFDLIARQVARLLGADEEAGASEHVKDGH